MTSLKRVAPVVLLSVVPGFAGAIGSLAEANTDTAQLLTSEWGIASGSYVLTYDPVYATGSNVSPIRASVTVVPPASTSSAPQETSSTDNSSAANADRERAPIFITQPNIGFQVVLTADYTVQGPEAPIQNPGNVVLTVGDVASLGVSSQFVNAPVEPREVSSAGALYVGDSKAAPTVLMSGSTLSVPGQTPPASPMDDSLSNSSPSPTAQFDGVAAAAAITSVPEPSTVFGVSLSFLALGWLRRRSKVR